MHIGARFISMNAIYELLTRVYHPSGPKSQDQKRSERFIALYAFATLVTKTAIFVTDQPAGFVAR